MKTLSAAALKALFSPDADADFIILLTITGTGIVTPIRLANNFVQRISETDDEVIHGVISRSNDYLYIPMTVNPPGDSATEAPRASITIHDLGQVLIPTARTIPFNTSISVLLEWVLNSSPNTVEYSFPGLTVAQSSGDDISLTFDLTFAGLSDETFPADSFNPTHFPAAF